MERADIVSVWKMWSFGQKNVDCWSLNAEREMHNTTLYQPLKLKTSRNAAFAYQFLQSMQTLCFAISEDPGVLSRIHHLADYKPYGQMKDADSLAVCAKHAHRESGLRAHAGNIVVLIT